MMDLIDTNQSCRNTDVINADEKLEQKRSSNKAPVNISDEMDSENIAEDGNTPDLLKEQNSYLRKEIEESYEIIKNICQSFDTFQRTIPDTDKITLLNNAGHDHASISERSPASCTPGNLLPNTTEHRIHALTETIEKDDDIDKKKVTFLNDAFNDYISTKEISPTSCISSNLSPNASEAKIRVVTEKNERNVREKEIIPTRASPTMEASTSGSTIIPKCENLPPISNCGFYKREMHCDVFKEPDFVTNDNTQYLQESHFSFEKLKRETFPERKEERMLKEVKEFFKNNSVDVTSNLDDLERRVWIITSSFFSYEFASKHGLPLPKFTPIQGINLPKDPEKARRLFVAYELMIDFGISEDDFFHYIYIGNQRLPHSIPWKLYKYSTLNQYKTDKLDHIQEQVGTDIFNMIYEQLRTDEGYRTLLRNRELLIHTVLFWYSYNDNRMQLLREQSMNSRNIFLSENQADCTPRGLSTHVLVSGTHGFQGPISPPSLIKTPGGLNHPDTQSLADDGKVEKLQKILKKSQSSPELSKEQSLNPNYILGTELKYSPMRQPANKDNKENRRSFYSPQSHSDKSNMSSIMSLYIQHFDGDEEKPRKMHLVTSRNSPNNAMHSFDQNFKEKSREIPSENSYEVLENTSNARFGVRKCIAQEYNEISRKKIRLQENSSVDLAEFKIEESPENI